MEPSVTVSRNQGSKIPDGWRASTGLKDGVARADPAERESLISRRMVGNMCNWSGIMSSPADEPRE